MNHSSANHTTEMANIDAVRDDITRAVDFCRESNGSTSAAVVLGPHTRVEFSIGADTVFTINLTHRDNSVTMTVLSLSAHYLQYLISDGISVRPTKEGIPMIVRAGVLLVAEVHDGYTGSFSMGPSSAYKPIWETLIAQSDVE